MSDDGFGKLAVATLIQHIVRKNYWNQSNQQNKLPLICRINRNGFRLLQHVGIGCGYHM